MHLDVILQKDRLEKEDLVGLLSVNEPGDVEKLRAAAEAVLLKNCGETISFRGLIEFSNICMCDCYYCGIRKGNRALSRYMLSAREILDAAKWCASQGYGSVVLQSGERRDDAFVSFVEDMVLSIKKETRSDVLPDGLGITLGVGEQSRQAYERFFRAGAHRYLLRIETSSPELFRRIHPPGQKLESRIQCLREIKEIGYQVGTGVMIGLPDQTIEHLADDILFFKEMDVDMIGMGPYIVHSQTPLSRYADEYAVRNESILQLSLKMIAAVRLALQDVNIASTTALQAISETGREEGLRFGANVIMPQITPVEVRRQYMLYDGKPCLDENAEQCRTCLQARIHSIGRKIAYNSWGDSKHFQRR